MRRRRQRWQAAGLAIGAAAGVAAVLRRERPRHAWRGLGSRARWMAGRLSGRMHDAMLGGPDHRADDTTVAERVRAALGPLTRSLDLPHVHVLVERHVALLHGDVGSEDDRAAVESLVREVPGVEGVESHLHVGLLPSDSRPSAGRQPSPELRRLVEVARHHGGGEATAPVAVKAVLGTVATVLDDRQRDRLRSHLPRDVAELLVPPRTAGRRRTVSSVDDLLASVVATGLVAPPHAFAVVDHLLAELSRLVPEDATEVALQLPEDVRRLWLAS